MKSYLHLIALVAFSFLAQTALAEAPVELSCTHEDQTHLRPENHRFAEVVYECTGWFSGFDPQCFNDAYPGITKGCVGCYKRLEKCARNHCALKCAGDPKGETCRDCSKKACGEAHEKCIGLKFDESPRFANPKA